MSALALAGALGAGLLLLAGRRGSGGAAGQVPCDDTPAAAARFRRADALAWVDCTGRTGLEVGELARLLERARRTDDAAAVRARWNARLDVERAAPDGAVPEAERALTGPAPSSVPEEPPRRRPRGRVTLPGDPGAEMPRRTDAIPEGRLGGYNPAEARRLAPTVARSLRSGGGYRTQLMRFQRAAGVRADGLYGPQSRAALRYYGVTNPRAAIVSRDAPEEYAPPSIETEPVSLGAGEDDDGGAS